MKVILILLAVLAGLVLFVLFFPIFVRVNYRGETLQAYAWVGPYRYNLLADEKKKKEKKEARTARQKDMTKLQALSDTAKYYVDLLRQDLGLIPILQYVLVIDNLMVRVRLNSEDPAELAMRYGEAWAVIGWVVTVLGNFFDIRRQDACPLIDKQVDGFAFEAAVKVHLTLMSAIRVVFKLEAQKAKYPTNRTTKPSNPLKTDS